MTDLDYLESCLAVNNDDVLFGRLTDHLLENGQDVRAHHIKTPTRASLP